MRFQSHLVLLLVCGASIPHIVGSEEKIAVTIHNNARCAISISYLNAADIVVPILSKVGTEEQGDLNSFEGHLFLAACIDKNLNIPLVQWKIPPSTARLHVYVSHNHSPQRITAGLTVSFECTSVGGLMGKCLDPQAEQLEEFKTLMPDDDVGGAPTKTLMPKLKFDNTTPLRIFVYWMTVNKRHKQADLAAKMVSSTVSHAGHTFHAERADGEGIGCTMKAGYFDQRWLIAYHEDTKALRCRPDVQSPLQLTIRNQASIEVTINGTDILPSHSKVFHYFEGDSVAVLGGPLGSSLRHTMGRYDCIVAVIPPKPGATEPFGLKLFPRDYDNTLIDISDEPATCKGAEPEPLASSEWLIEGDGGEKRVVDHFADFGNELGVFRVENFISAHECEVLTNTTRGWAGRAKTEGGQADAGRLAYTSNLYYEPHKPEGEVSRVISRVFEFSRYKGLDVALEGQEPLNMIEYVENEHYKPHCDSTCGGGQYQKPDRVATMIMYCQVADEGGGTAFINANMVIHAKVGDAIFFRYKTDDGQMDPRSQTLHSGCPVLAGEKKIITQWVREGVSAQETWDGRAWL